MPCPADDPVLLRLRQALEAEYGPRLERAVLFGSRARGDAGPESDYDVAVFLTDIPNRWNELGRLASINLRIFDETGALVDLIPRLAGTAEQPTAFLREVERDGIPL